MDLKPTFVREVFLANCAKSLKIHQLEEGECGCVLWDAGLVLLHYLLTKTGQQHVKGNIVLELGAGTGAVGLTSILSGAVCAILTDLPTHISLLVQNILTNLNVLNLSEVCGIQKSYSGSKLSRCHVSDKVTAQLLVGADVLCWGKESDAKVIMDIIQRVSDTCCAKPTQVTVLIADCIYYQEGVDCLLKTIIWLISKFSPHIEILCSFERRTIGNKQQVLQTFLDNLENKHQLHVTEIPHSDMDEIYQSEDISIILIKPFELRPST